MTDLSDNEILRRAEEITKRRVKERSLSYQREYIKRPEVKARHKKARSRPEVKARAKELRNTPEQLAKVRERTQRPEAKEKDRNRTRAAYWAKHYPGQPVPPGRIEKELWREEHDGRLRAAEAAVDF